jgi:hypothetical protein
VVPDAGEQLPPGDQVGDPLGGGQVDRDGLLHEHRHPGRDHRLLRRPVRERRHADVHRVRPGGQQLLDVAERPGAVRGGQFRRRLRHHVGHPEQFHVLETAQHPGVALRHPAGPYQSHPARAHVKPFRHGFTFRRLHSPRVGAIKRSPGGNPDAPAS